MLSIPFAIAAAKEAAEVSYAIYLYYIGATLTGSAVVGGGIWLFTPKKLGQQSENDAEIDVELGLQQQQPLKFAADILLNVDEKTQTTLIRQTEHVDVLSDSIHQFNESLLHITDSTTQIRQLIQPLHETAIYAEETTQTMALKLKRAEEQLASVTHELQKTQSALHEKELQLLDSMGQLTTSQEQLTVTTHATSRQLKNLSSQHQTAIHLTHPDVDLSEQTIIKSLNNTIEEQADLLQELSDENDALQAIISARSIEHVNSDSSTQRAKGSTFTMFGSGQ